MTASPKDAPHIRIADLVTLQQRVIRAIATQSQITAAVRGEAQAAVLRTVDKLIRLEGDAATFAALSAAAWEAVGAGDLTDRLKDVAARVALAGLEKKHGAQSALEQMGGKDFERGLVLRREMDALVAARDGLSKRMADVTAHNNRADTLSVDERMEKKFKESSVLSRMSFTQREADAYAVYAAYNKQWVGSGQPVNYFDDARKHRKLSIELDEKQTELNRQHERYQARSAALYEMVAQRRLIGQSGRSAVDYEGLVSAVCDKLQNEAFLSALSRHMPLAKGGPLMAAAVKAEALQAVESSLTTLGAEAIDTLAVLENEVQPLAQENKRISAVNMAEEDAHVLAGLAGYMCISAAAAVNALATFQTDEAESAVSLRRTLRMHMAGAGKVDPAYINEVMGMDQTTAGHFNIDRLTTRPDIKRVLADTGAVARVDRRYAAFLEGMAAGDDLDGIGFGNVRLDAAAFGAIMEQTRPNIPAAQQFAEIARLSKGLIGQARENYVRGLEAAPEQTDEKSDDGKKRRHDGPQP